MDVEPIIFAMLLWVGQARCPLPIEVDQVVTPAGPVRVCMAPSVLSGYRSLKDCEISLPTIRGEFARMGGKIGHSLINATCVAVRSGYPLPPPAPKR